MPLYSEFFACLISKLKYKPEYKDKFLELIFFGGYKNYDGQYEFPAYENQDKIDWENKLELLRFIDPNFIRDNLDNNLVQKYLKTVGKSNLYKSDKISFLFNATKLNYGDKKTVGEFFRNSPNPKVIVNDTNNLIGA